MVIREATVADIPQIQVVRNSVAENTLSDPSRVTDADCLECLTATGKGWVCEINSRVVGFSVADISGHNIWALFVHPCFERQGIGRCLHSTMLEWYFSQTETTVWLGTAPKTRAEIFYRKAGWIEIGTHSSGEIKFEMTFAGWKNRQ